jgi:hypothetical protein
MALASTQLLHSFCCVISRLRSRKGGVTICGRSQYVRRTKGDASLALGQLVHRVLSPAAQDPTLKREVIQYPENHIQFLRKTVITS